MRMLHTMLRVGDLERSVKFYTEVLGMKLLRTTDRPEQKYTLAFVGYDTEDRTAVLELLGHAVERVAVAPAVHPHDPAHGQSRASSGRSSPSTKRRCQSSTLTHCQMKKALPP